MPCQTGTPFIIAVKIGSKEKSVNMIFQEVVGKFKQLKWKLVPSVIKH